MRAARRAGGAGLGHLAAATLLVWAAGAAAQPYAYVANLGSDDISVIDAAGNTVVATLPGGQDPDGAAVSPDGSRVYITNFLSDSLTAIDTTTNTVIATAPLAAGPVGLAVSPDGARLYIANRGADLVSVLDATSLEPVTTIAVGRGPNAVAITPDGTTAYVTNSFTHGPGEVSVLDLATNSVRATVAVQHTPNRVAITPDGRTAYVTNFRSWNVSAIDTGSDAIATTLRVGYKPQAVAVNPNGAYAYVATRGLTESAGNLQVIDVATNRVRESLFVGSQPTAIGILRHGGTAYVTNFWSSAVTVVDLGDELALGSVPVGEAPFAVAVNCVGAGCSESPYTPKPTKTVTETPTITETPTPTPTPSQTATRTATRTLPPGLEHVSIELAPYPDGDPPLLDVMLRSGGQQVLSFSHEILFAGALRVATNGLGEPHCDLFEAPSGTSSRFAFLPDGCTFNCDGLRAELTASEPFPELDGPLVPYFCVLEIPDFLDPGSYRLRNVDTAASGPQGEVLATRGRDGIVVIVPPATPSPQLTAVPTRTTRPMATPIPEAFLRLGSVNGRPGARVPVEIRLDTHGRAIAGIQLDIVSDPTHRVAALANGRPDCAVNPAINKPGTAFAFQPSGCSATTCRTARAIVLAFDNTDPIDDGSLLFTCQLAIAANAAPGTYPLRGSESGASDPHGTVIETGVIDGVVNVFEPAAGIRPRTAAAVQRCSAGANDGEPCGADGDCAGGACVITQGVCAGGADDGLLCDCPGGTCVAEPECGTDPRAGTCRGGALDGACCDRAFNCAGGSCTGSHRLCAGGTSKGMPCIDEDQCLGADCVASGRRCRGGEFDRVSCIDDGDCPRGDCLDPNAPTPTAPPTATTTPRPPGAEDDGCAVVAPQATATPVLWPLLLALVWMVRPGRKG